jgi:predicted HicB family RNase H-like nuclease
VYAGNVSKRVNLTLADSVYKDLEAWADTQGRPVANLANHVIEKAIETAKAAGEIPKTQNDDSVAAEFIKALVRGKQPSLEDVSELARSLSLSVHELLEICDRLFPDKT